MARKYFEVFPTIKYNGYNCKNLLASATLVDRYTNIPYIFYRFDLDQDERADVISNQVYNDPYMTWLLYYSNKVQDPYYGWYLTEDDFHKYIKKKYGSIEYTQKKILYFRTNWYTDNRELSQTQFNAFFGQYKEPHSNYWTTNYDENSGRLISYVRKKNDILQNTNKMIKVQVSNNIFSNSSLKITTNNIVDIKTGASTVGSADIEFANSSVLIMKHVLGNIANNYNIHLDNSNTFCTITSYSNNYNATANSWTKLYIPEDEYIYWEPVYIYDQELEDNTLKRNIRLLDGKTAYTIHDKLEAEFKS